MIYFENVDVIEVNNSKEAVAEKHMASAKDSYWSLCIVISYGNLCVVCNADTIEELCIWADLHGLKIVNELTF